MLVSCADKLDNLRSIVYDHNRIGNELWNRFNATKEQQAWYYSSIAKIASEKGKANSILAELANEMNSLVKQVFL